MSSSVASGTRSRAGASSSSAEAYSSGVAMGAPVTAVAAGAPIPASERALRDLFLEGWLEGSRVDELDVDVVKGSAWPQVW
jgi:hypothetical protein